MVQRALNGPLSTAYVGHLITSAIEAEYQTVEAAEASLPAISRHVQTALEMIGTNVRELQLKQVASFMVDALDDVASERETPLSRPPRETTHLAQWVVRQMQNSPDHTTRRLVGIAAQINPRQSLVNRVAVAFQAANVHSIDDEHDGRALMQAAWLGLEAVTSRQVIDGHLNLDELDDKATRASMRTVAAYVLQMGPDGLAHFMNAPDYTGRPIDVDGPLIRSLEKTLYRANPDLPRGFIRTTSGDVHIRELLSAALSQSEGDNTHSYSLAITSVSQVLRHASEIARLLPSPSHEPAAAGASSLRNGTARSQVSRQQQVRPVTAGGGRRPAAAQRTPARHYVPKAAIHGPIR